MTMTPFVLTIDPGTWLIISAGGAGRVESVVGSARTEQDALALVSQCGFGPVYLVECARTRAIP
jgi:hypothetical protein